MAENAQQVILDSEYTTAGSLLELERWSRAEEGRPALADMAWTRIAPWQDMCARFFDEPRTEHAAAITRVTLHQASESGARLGSEGALFLGWLATRLGWRAGRMGGALRMRRADGRDVSLHVGAVARPEGVAPAALASITIEAALGGVTLKGTIDRGARKRGQDVGGRRPTRTSSRGGSASRAKPCSSSACVCARTRGQRSSSERCTGRWPIRCWSRPCALPSTSSKMG